MNILSGEKIQQLCDLYIGSREQTCINPFIQLDKEKHVYIESASKLPKTAIQAVFIYTDVIHWHFEKVYNLLSTISTPFTLFLHNSDHGFQENHCALLVLENLKHIYTQNLEIPATDKITPLPIGIANRMWKHGNVHVWNQYKVSKKTKHIYLNFQVSTNTQKRQNCLSIMVSKNILNQPNMDYRNYIEHLSQFEFAICPEGNGLDTHRFWECLYVKTIPICLANPITKYFSQHFPIVLLESWEDLDLNTLHYTEDWPNTYPLDFEKWKQKHGFDNKPKINFMTFGGGPMDMLYAVDRLVSQAKSLKLFDNVYGIKENDLKEDHEFWNKHGYFLVGSRGFGCWMWKPYLIQKIWNTMNNGDILLYCDSGNELDTRKKSILEKHLLQVSTELVMGCYPGEKANMRQKYLNEIYWNKKDLLIRLNMENNEEALHTNQYQANPLLLYKCPRTTEMINEWCHVATSDYHLIDDSPSVEPNFEGFQQHRHDQSIFSLLCKKYKLFSEITLENSIDVLRNKTGNSMLSTLDSPMSL